MDEWLQKATSPDSEKYRTPHEYMGAVIATDGYRLHAEKAAREKSLKFEDVVSQVEPENYYQATMQTRYLLDAIEDSDVITIRIPADKGKPIELFMAGRYALIMPFYGSVTLWRPDFIEQQVASSKDGE